MPSKSAQSAENADRKLLDKTTAAAQREAQLRKERQDSLAATLAKMAKLKALREARDNDAKAEADRLQALAPAKPAAAAKKTPKPKRMRPA